MASWNMFALQGGRAGETVWLAVGSERYVTLHGVPKPTPVTVTEDPEGVYLG